MAKEWISEMNGRIFLGVFIFLYLNLNASILKRQFDCTTLGSLKESK